MKAKNHNWLVWFIPLTLCTGIVIGALIGMSFALDAISQEGAEGDMAGAAGALMIVICVLVGFPAGMFTIVISKIMRRPAPQHMATRFTLSIGGGTLIGGTASLVQAEQFIIAWLILVFGSVLVTWFCATTK